MLAIYCRISQLKEKDKDVSISVQEEKGKTLAKQLGVPFQVYKDLGVSGTLPIEKRPQLLEMFREMEHGKITHVYTYDNSRMERNTLERFKIIDILKDHRVKWFLDRGEFDYNDIYQKLHGNIESLINSHSVEVTRAKVRDAISQKVERGEYRGGIRPYGYTVENKVLVIDSEEAKIVKKIYELSLSGKGQRGIAIWLNENGIPTRYAKLGSGTMTRTNKYTKEQTTIPKKSIQWADNTVRGILTNTIYKGEKKHRSGFVDAPALFTPEYWLKAQENLQSNRNNSGKKVEHKYLLKGLLRCGQCGRNYTGRSRVNMKDHYYQCSSKRNKGQSCGNRSVNIDKMESLVWQRLFASEDLLDHIKNTYFNETNISKTQELEKLRTQNEQAMKALQGQKDKAIELVLEGLVSEDDLQNNLNRISRKNKELADENEMITKEIELHQNSQRILQKYSTQFEKYTKISSFNEKKLIVNDFIKNIIILSKEGNYYISIYFNITLPQKRNPRRTVSDAEIMTGINFGTKEVYLVGYQEKETKGTKFYLKDNEDWEPSGFNESGIPPAGGGKSGAPPTTIRVPPTSKNTTSKLGVTLNRVSSEIV